MLGNYFNKKWKIFRKEINP